MEKLDKETKDFITDQSIIHDFDPKPIIKVLERKTPWWSWPLLFIIIYGPIIGLYALGMWLLWW